MELPLLIRGISNLTDARYFASKGAHWLSFNFEKGGAIDSKFVLDVMNWINGPYAAGEFFGYTAKDIDDTVFSAGLTKVVLPEDSRDIINDIDADVFLLAKLGVGAPQLNNFRNLSNTVEAFVVQTSAQEEVDVVLDNLRSLISQFNIIVDLQELPHERLSDLMALSPYGLAISAGEEEKTGVKDFGALDTLFELIRSHP